MAARAAAANGPSGTLPQGSALLWALLQHCLKQQAEALIEQHSYKAAAKEAMAQVRLLLDPHSHDESWHAVSVLRCLCIRPVEPGK